MVMRLCNALIIVTLFLSPSLALAVQLEAVPDRTRVGLEESFTLELRATGSVDGEPDLSVLEKDFELLGRSQSSQVQIINTDISRTTTWTLSLLARSAGSKEVPPLCIEDDCSKPVVIQVLPEGQMSGGLSGESQLLLEVSTDPDKVWVQSQLLYTVRLFTRLNFLQASLTEPEVSGVEAVVQKLGDDRSYETERDGLRYQVIERSYAIFPQQSGRLTIPPIRFAAQVAEGGRRNFDPFNQRTRQLRKRSQEVSVEVLPAAAGGRNWLPASSLQLEDDWQQPPQLTVGEPATRTITLRAGGVPSAQLPVLKVAVPDGVRSYPDQPSREDKALTDGILGVLQQKLALVPTRPGTLRLPEIKVDWWDLSSESWRQALLPAVELEVMPASGQAKLAETPPAVQAKPPVMPKTDVQPQAERPVPTAAAEPGFWPWLSLALGFGWLFTLLLILKNKLARRKDATPKENQETSPSLKAANKELQQALRSKDQARLRSALLGWGAALFPDRAPRNLDELGMLGGEALRDQLEIFSRSLYSRTPAAWDEQKLGAAIELVEQEAAAKANIEALPPLYPR